MDMSNFHRKNKPAGRMELTVLLAEVAARQAMTPTALCVATQGDAQDMAPFAPEIRPFLVATRVSRAGAERSVSFNSDVAGALLTRAKGS